MTAEANDWLAERQRLRGALSDLSEAGQELGIPAAERGPWATAAAALADPVMVLLAGPEGAGTRKLASAVVGADLELDHQPDETRLTIWKYGFEEGEIGDGSVLECYRPVQKLAGCEFAEFAPAGIAEGAEVAERAYAMCDLVLLVFSARDPWDRGPWEFVRGLHRRRRRPTAAVLTDVDQRTGEEIAALVEHLRSTADSALAEELPVFSVKSDKAMLGGGGVSELQAWISEAASLRPTARKKRERAEGVLRAAAARAGDALSSSSGDSDGEAGCVRWMDAEIMREREAAGAEAAGAFAAARDAQQESNSRTRSRLARSLGPLGVPASLLRGGGWLVTAQERAGESAGKAAQDAARKLVRGAGDRLDGLRRRIEERALGVFGENAEIELDSAAPAEPALGGEDMVRRCGARAQEAAGKTEGAQAVAAMLGTRRVMLWLITLAVVGGVAASLWLAGRGSIPLAAITGSTTVVALLWGAVFLRGRGRAVLARYDAGANSAREEIGRELERASAPELDRVYQRYSDGLAGLRELAAQRSEDRQAARVRLEGAIALASDLPAGEDQPEHPYKAVALAENSEL